MRGEAVTGQKVSRAPRPGPGPVYTLPAQDHRSYVTTTHLVHTEDPRAHGSLVESSNTRHSPMLTTGG
ncbi:hypothetical protein Hamer_G023054 [Homarus americanus]|uniref:Uncharacterized protein n=1 Tax=Homarus americanus TaxID=6706 RepID=A0A8J5JUH0_HOMAM|nr:hypothetical protein Hamer_G023054 [Homarus americanus]